MDLNKLANNKDVCAICRGPTINKIKYERRYFISYNLCDTYHHYALATLNDNSMFSIIHIDDATTLCVPINLSNETTSFVYANVSDGLIANYTAIEYHIADFYFPPNPNLNVVIKSPNFHHIFQSSTNMFIAIKRIKKLMLLK